MNAVEMISLYGNLFYVSLAIAVIGLGLSVFFFFYFDIPTVRALMTGKAKEETIRRMAEQNAKTGNLRNQHIHTGPTGRTGKTKNTGNTGALTQNVAAPVQHTVQPPASGQTAPLTAYQSNETTVLQDYAQDTTVLGGNGQETTVLGGNGQETTVLGGYGQDTTVLRDYGDTMVLGGNGQDTTVLNAYSEDTMVLNQSANYSGQTAVLDGAPAQASAAFRFQVTENTLVIHTNEII